MPSSSAEETGVLPRASEGRIDLRRHLMALLAAELETASRRVISIAGPGCTGKSTFALDLAADLARRGRGGAVLDLDCYLIERATREAFSVPAGGYDPRGYRLDQAAIDVERLLSGRSIEVSPYDKRTSGRGRPVRIEPAETLIIEGSMALQPAVRPFGSVRLYFDAPQPVLYANRRRRELGLGLSSAEIDDKFAKLCIDYERHIRSQAEQADLRIEIDGSYDVLRLEVAREGRGRKKP